MLVVLIVTTICILKEHLILGEDLDSLPPYKYVNTSYGHLKGQLVSNDLGSTYHFLGIPYATPPVGDLRFKRPRPAQPWTGTIGDKLPPACVQYSQHPYPWYDQQPGKSEDCLYLNVWTPAIRVNKEPLHVLVFIHGGGFSYGSNRMDIYNGTAYGATLFEYPGRTYIGSTVIESYRGVVMVTVNYRLGALGFLSAGTEDAPGSVGIYDMLMAIHWIRDNIHAFNGDPDSITLYGQDAGSIAISLMCVSPLFEGLFKRVILHSGTFVSFKENHLIDNFRLSQRLAEAVGCSEGNKTLLYNTEEVVACLRGVNATKLAVTLNSFNPTAPFAFYPEYNTELFPSDPVQALKDGKVHDVDMIIGGSITEGSYLLTSMYPDEFGVFGEKDNGGINKTLAETILKEAFKTYSEPEAIVDYFLKDFSGDNDQIRKQTYTALGDDRIFCPLVYFAEKYGDHKGKVRFFQFSLHPFGFPWAEWMESVHFNNGPYLLSRPLSRLSYESNEKERKHALVALAFRYRFALFMMTGHVHNEGEKGDFILSDGTYLKHTRFLTDAEARSEGAHRRPLWEPELFSSVSHGYNLFNDSAGQDEMQEIVQIDIRHDPQKSNCDFLRKYHGF